MADKQQYDFAGWRARLGWTADQARVALGCSRSYYWGIEKAGQGKLVDVWACYGLEVYHQAAASGGQAA